MIFLRHKRLFSQSLKATSDLYLKPESWRGLPAKKIMGLHQERVIKLGPQYTKSRTELNALLSTSQETGVPEHEIAQIYGMNKESGSEEITAGRLSGINPMMDGDFTKYSYDEYSSSAQDLIDQHRTARQYNRVAAFELPLLAKYRAAYKPPAKDQILTFRYTSYVGEEHPADRKVVVKAEFDKFAAQQKLGSDQQHKLKLLLGKRYNQMTNEIHMSSEKFKYPTQNFKYLLVKITQLVEEAKKNSQEWTSLPIDTRLYSRKMKVKAKKEKINAFPESWLRPEDAPQKKNEPERVILRELLK